MAGMATNDILHRNVTVNSSLFVALYHNIIQVSKVTNNTISQSVTVRKAKLEILSENQIQRHFVL